MKKMILVVTTLLFAVAGTATARQVDLDLSLSTPFLVAGQDQTAFLKVSLSAPVVDRGERTAANVAIVLDRSGSMGGDKIRQAKEAALLAIDLLDSRDIVSVITYSDTVSVLVPATRVSDREQIKAMIRGVQADGNTALFAGVSKGAREVRKFLDRNRVNRVILLSDGLANVGPSSPGSLGELGASLKTEGISVTTIGLGLGYNEDLMVRLARASDGNHSFVESSADLVRIFNYEFNDILSVAARQVDIRIQCHDGVRPLRLINRDGEIVGSSVYATINELYGGQEKYLLVEVRVPRGQAGAVRDVAHVEVSYADPQTRRLEDLSDDVQVAFTESQKRVDQSRDKEVLSEVILQEATEVNEQAVKLRDEGRVEEARELLLENAARLRRSAVELEAPALADYGEANASAAEGLADDDAWAAQRKGMLEEQHGNRVQQSY
jgi:Ca-activated chloride channel family protein